MDIQKILNQEQEIEGLLKAIKAIQQWRVDFAVESMSIDTALRMFKVDAHEYSVAANNLAYAELNAEKHGKNVFDLLNKSFRYSIVQMLYTLVQYVETENKIVLNYEYLKNAFEKRTQRMYNLHYDDINDQNEFIAKSVMSYESIFDPYSPERMMNEYHISELFANMIYLSLNYGQIYPVEGKSYENSFWGIDGCETAFELVNMSNYSKRMNVEQYSSYILGSNVEIFEPKYSKDLDTYRNYVVDINISKTELLKIVQRDRYFYLYNMVGELKNPPTYISLSDMSLTQKIDTYNRLNK